MKLKVVVVDLEIPARTKRLALKIGIPLAVLVGGGAVAWASNLHTWNTGDTLQATDLNGNFTNLQAQITALQTQLAALSPTYVAYSYDAATPSQADLTIPASMISITPTANVTCVLTDTCNLSQQEVTSFDEILIEVSANGGALAACSAEAGGVFSTYQASGSDALVTATTTAGTVLQAGTTYTFASFVKVVPQMMGGAAGCALTVVCGGAAGG
jgi:hypothetical protein